MKYKIVYSEEATEYFDAETVKMGEFGEIWFVAQGRVTKFIAAGRWVTVGEYSE